METTKLYRVDITHGFNWSSKGGVGPFTSFEQAEDTANQLRWLDDDYHVREVPVNEASKRKE